MPPLQSLLTPISPPLIKRRRAIINEERRAIRITSVLSIAEMLNPVAERVEDSIDDEDLIDEIAQTYGVGPASEEDEIPEVISAPITSKEAILAVQMLRT